jgi:hypothetical protein
MPAEYPPFMNGYGVAAKILNKIKEAQTPERFTVDFLSTKLGFNGGTARPFIPLAKRLGLLESDGRPSELYKRFRNPSQSKAAMAAAIQKGYSTLYQRNEYAHELPKDKLAGLIVEITGLEQGHNTTRAIVGTFEVLKQFASFDKDHSTGSEEIVKKETKGAEITTLNPPAGDRMEEVRLNIAYTINLVLPKSDDVAVFNAIFKSLQANLLTKK